MILLGYLVFAAMAILLWFSPWMPPGEKAKPVTIRLWHLMLVVLACALFLAWVRAVLEEVLRPPPQPSPPARSQPPLNLSNPKG